MYTILERKINICYLIGTIVKRIKQKYEFQLYICIKKKKTYKKHIIINVKNHAYLVNMY